MLIVTIIARNIIVLLYYFIDKLFRVANVALPALTSLSPLSLPLPPSFSLSPSPFSFLFLSHPIESISSADDDEDGFRKKKKPRTAFSREQVGELEKKFTEKKYLSSAERGELAEKLKLSDMQVKTWFQNRRMKYKRQTEEAEMELKSPKYPYSSFVPYTSIYGYMPPYKGDYGNGGGSAGYGTSLSHTCSQQYVLSSPDSYSSCYSAPATMSPLPATQRYSPSHQHRAVNGGVFFNRGGVSPLSSPSTPVSGNSYSTSYFNGDFNATTQQYSEWIGAHCIFIMHVITSLIDSY